MLFPGRTGKITPVHLLTSVLPTAWQLIGTDNGAEVLSGDWTGGEHASTAQGDLLVCSLGYRSNAAFTLPAGWGLVATQQSSGDTVVGVVSSIASGLMAWIIRGASAPSFVFTRTGGDVGRGSIITYRGCHASPYDTGSANTLAVGSATTTTTTITTAENNELLVAMCAAAVNTAHDTFDAATGATTASSGSDGVTMPTSNTWLRRRAVGSAGGADMGLSVADAVMTTAGATGQLSAIGGNNGRHVMIVGAFKKAA